MNTSNPKDHVSDADIERFRTRALPAAALVPFTAHLQDCPPCRARAARGRDLGALQASLEASLRAWADHVPEEDVQRYVSGRLSGERRDEIAAHLDRCADCAAEVRDLESFAAADRQTRSFSRGWRYGMLAAAATILLAVAIGAMRWTRHNPPLVVLNDAGGPVTVDARGGITGAGTIAPADAALVADAVRRERVTMPAMLADLRGRTGTLLGEVHDAPLRLISPVGTAVMDARPSLHWTPVPGASAYVVTVQDQSTGATIDSSPVRDAAWTPRDPLPRAHTYVWQVSTSLHGQTIVAPRPPEPPARFFVIGADDAARLAGAPASHLVRGILYANAGLLDEADQELTALLAENPGSRVVGTLSKEVKAARATER